MKRCQFCNMPAVATVNRIDKTGTPFCLECLRMAEQSTAFPGARRTLAEIKLTEAKEEVTT